MIVPKRSIALSLYILSFIFTANNIYASLGKWKEIKPFYGTNVNVMAKHPSGKIFVGTTHDGVYISDDGDKNWKQCYYYRTKTILQSIVSMAIDSSGVIYLGAEDDGIIKSSDEGRTWINCNFPASQENVFCVAINNEGYVFAGTKNGVYLSKDAAVSWTKILDSYIVEWSSYVNVRRITIKDDIIYAALDQWGLKISNDLGNNWSESRLPQSLYHSVLVINQNEIYVALHHPLPWLAQGLFKTTNGGQNWFKITNGLTTDQINYLTIDSDNSIFASGILGRVFKSDITGEKWTEICSGLSCGEGNGVLTEGNKILIGNSSSGIITSTDGGKNWKFSNNGFNKVPTKSLIKLNDGSLLISNTAGIFNFDPNTQEYTSSNKFIFNNSTNFNGHLPGMEINELIQLKNKSIFASTYQGIFFRSDNLGKSWSWIPISSNPDMIIQFKKINDEDLYFTAVGYKSGIYRSKDDGLTWESLGINMTGCFAVTATDSKNIYAGIGNWLYYSTNGGYKWEHFSYWFEGWILDIKFSASNDLYVMTRGGLYRSTDNGRGWTHYNFKDYRDGGNIPVTLFCKQITEISSNHLLLATEKGFYESLDNGITWNKRYDELKDYNIAKVIETDDKQFYAITGEGFYQIDSKNTVTDVEKNGLPSIFSLEQNYPNPFNPTTTINYQLPQDGFVTIKVYDILGKEVAVLVNENKTAGYYKVNFDGSRLTSGIYLYTIQANNLSLGSGQGFVQSKKMLMIK